MSDINRDWEKVYEVEATPWDVGQPEDALVEFIGSGLVKPCRVLEIGCGNGNDAIFLAKKGFDVTAIDISKNAIENAKSRAKKAEVKCKFLVGDIIEIKHFPEIFEFVYDRGCFHFVPKNKREKYVEIVKKSLAKKGYFLLIVSSDKETPKGPYQFSKQDIKEIFGNDFDILDIRLITLTQHKEKPTPYLCTMKRK
jgi:SAM-dependent methyltransferase